MEQIPNGYYDNQKPAALMSDIFNPINYNIADIESMAEALNVFQDWLQKHDVEDIDLISSALKEILKADHEETKLP